MVNPTQKSSQYDRVRFSEVAEQYVEEAHVSLAVFVRRTVANRISVTGQREYRVRSAVRYEGAVATARQTLGQTARCNELHCWRSDQLLIGLAHVTQPK